jgi:hypothetical protein
MQKIFIEKRRFYVKYQNCLAVISHLRVVHTFVYSVPLKHVAFVAMKYAFVIYFLVSPVNLQITQFRFRSCGVPSLVRRWVCLLHSLLILDFSVKFRALKISSTCRL